MTMPKAHIDVREGALLVVSRIPANSGHTLHRNTPREAFVREFLELHFPASLAIGAGEIIKDNSSLFMPVIHHRSF